MMTPMREAAIAGTMALALKTCGAGAPTRRAAQARAP